MLLVAHTSPTERSRHLHTAAAFLLTHPFQTEASCISASSPWPPCTQSTERGEENRESYKPVIVLVYIGQLLIYLLNEQSSSIKEQSTPR